MFFAKKMRFLTSFLEELDIKGNKIFFYIIYKHSLKTWTPNLKFLKIKFLISKDCKMGKKYYDVIFDKNTGF